MVNLIWIVDTITSTFGTDIGGGGGVQDKKGNIFVKEGCNNWILEIKDKIAHPHPHP